MNEKDKIYILEIENQIKYLKCGTYLIGRIFENISHDIVLNDASVDIKHAILNITQNEIKIIDLFSKNGTYVNNELIPKAEYFQIHHNTTQLSLSIALTFGNCKGIFRFSSPSKEDSGFHDHQDIIRSDHQINNKSDIIISVSPERNTSQKSLRSKFLNMANNVLISNVTKTKTNEKSFLIPSTQASNHKLGISHYDESVQKNIELLEEEDDFYIPETQQIFNRTRNSDIESDLKQSQKSQNRIFNENEPMIRICTQDFNEIEEDEKTFDSDDLLRNKDLSAIENLNVNETRKSLENDVVLMEIGKDKVSNKDKELNSKNKNDITSDDTKTNNNAVDDDEWTDCEEELSDNQFKKKLRSRSATPDLDMILNKHKNNDQNSSKDALSISKFPSMKDDESDDTQMLIPTQIFTSKTNSKNVVTEKSIENLFNVSPSNKENAPNIMENVKENFLDDSLEETQIFIHNKNPEKSILEKQINDFVKPRVSITSTITSKSKPESNAIECQSKNDDDEMLEPTQLFIPPSAFYAKSNKSPINTKTNSTSSFNNNRLFSPPQSSLSLSQFNFDICTPNWDNLKLPTEDKIKEGGKLFNTMTKNQKREKQLFEESPSSDSSDDDSDTNDKKEEKKSSKKMITKIADEIKTIEKNKNNGNKNQKNGKNENKKQKVKDNKIDDNCQKNTIKERRNTHKSDDKNKNKHITSELHKTKNDEKIPLEKNQIGMITRTRSGRITSKDSNSSLNQNQKRGHDNEVTDDETRNNKKRKQEITFFILTSAKPKIVFTKIDSTKYKSELKKLGAKIVVNPSECDILITEQVYWTWKFIAAVARGIPIVSPKWIEDAVKSPNNMSLIENYLLKDNEAEKKYNFNLKKSLQAAQKQPIFKDYSFLITPKTKPPVEELIKIIECGGGKILRTISSIHQNVNSFYVVSDKEDMIMWHKIRKNSKNVQIIGTDGIMMSVLQQRITFNNYLLS